jgi:DNA polymerase elongation subunit (family B)
MKSIEQMTDAELEAYIELCDTKYIEYKVLQESLKVLCNGIYGCMGNQYFRFYDLRMAEAITLTGQAVIETSSDFMNVYMNKLCKTENHDYVLALDTDSNYIDFSALVERVASGKSDAEIVEFLDRLAKEKIQPFIATQYDAFGERTNAYESRLFMKREAIGKALFLEKKKRYIMKVYDNEGVRFSEPEMKIMGLESVRSDFPMWCRKRLEECFQMLFDFTQESLWNKVETVRNDFFKLNVMEMAKPTSISDLKKYIDHRGMPIKGATAQAKGSALYNLKLKEHKIGDKYPTISSGDKVRILPLKMPNPLKIESIAFKDKLPHEFGIDEYVDKHTLFSKNFIAPLERVVAVIGWSTERKFSLDDFFE